MTARSLFGGGLASVGVLVLLSPILFYVAAVASLLALTLRMINAAVSVVEAALLLIPVLAVALVASLVGADIAAAIDRGERALPRRRAMAREPRVAEPMAPARMAQATGRKGGEREDRSSR